MESVSTVVGLLLLVVMSRERTRGNAFAKKDKDIQLKKSQRLRTFRLEVLEPAFGALVIGSLMVTDLGHSPFHWLAVLPGLVAGYYAGKYRAHVTYVSAVPKYQAVILRYSVEAVVTILLLVGIKLVAENDLLPKNGIFPLLLGALLGFLVIESAARVYTLWRWYQRDAAKQATTDKVA